MSEEMPTSEEVQAMLEADLRAQIEAKDWPCDEERPAGAPQEPQTPGS